MLRPLTEVMLEIYFSEQDHLLASCRIEEEKFYPGPELEPGHLALCANLLTTKLSRTSMDP